MTLQILKVKIQDNEGSFENCRNCVYKSQTRPGNDYFIEFELDRSVRNFEDNLKFSLIYYDKKTKVTNTIPMEEGSLAKVPLKSYSARFTFGRHADTGVYKIEVIDEGTNDEHTTTCRDDDFNKLCICVLNRDAKATKPGTSEAA